MHSDFSYLLKTHPFPTGFPLSDSCVCVLICYTVLPGLFLPNLYEIINGHKTENNNSFSPESIRSQEIFQQGGVRHCGTLPTTTTSTAHVIGSSHSQTTISVVRSLLEWHQHFIGMEDSMLRLFSLPVAFCNLPNTSTVMFPAS